MRKGADGHGRIPRDSKELKRWLGRKLGRAVEDWLWHVLGAERSDFLSQPDVEHLGFILERARECLKIGRLAARRRVIPGRPRKPVSIESLLTRGEQARAEAVRDYVAREASSLEEVREFREHCLGGRLLREDEVDSFAASSLNRMFGLAFFRSKRIPVVGHRVDAVHSRPRGLLPNIKLDVRWNSGGKTIYLPADLYFHVADGGTIQLRIAGTANGRSGISILRGSVLAALRDVSLELAESYLWDEGDAARFILTGKAPPMHAAHLDIRYGLPHRMIEGRKHLDTRSRPRIVAFRLAAYDWVSAASLRRILEHLCRRGQPRGTRTLGEKGLQVFRYVEACRESPSPRPTWRAMLADWNRQHPNWRFSDASAMHRAYDRVKQTLLAAPQDALATKMRNEPKSTVRAGRHRDRL
jgi:hypothetical protein